MNRESSASARSGAKGHVFIVAGLLVLLIGPIFGPVPDFLRTRFGIETSVIMMLIAFVVGFSIVLGVILRFGEMRSDTWRQKLASLGWGQPSRAAAVVLAIVLGLAWGALFLASARQLVPDANLTEFSLFRVAAILIAVFGAIQEDLITRGYVMNSLRQINVPPWGQLVLSALLFALYHAVWSLNVLSFVFSVIFGLILGGLFLWGKRSLTPVIVAHTLPVIISEPFSSMLIFLAPGA